MTANRPFVFPRAQALPDGPGRAGLWIDGIERVGLDFGRGGPRPFFDPILGPSGHGLTRFGHPNPVGHEHHRSVWFGHEKVGGLNFWSERPGDKVEIIHKRILVYQDGPGWAGLAAEWEWRADGATLMTQSIIAAIEPREVGGYALDVQSRFVATRMPVELGKTNFGFLGVRVAKTMSEQFGGGRLTNADGATGEPAIFGKPSRWVDYSGPVAPEVVEGIAYFDHPTNHGHPTHWHVRADGWMEAAFNLAGSYLIAPDHPLDLRYRLLIHEGNARVGVLDREWRGFAESPAYRITPAKSGTIPTLERVS